MFIQKDTLSFWYLAAGAAGGALTEFDLSGECTLGGYLMAVGTWTVDGGAGPDDRIAFVTSQGEIIVYEGTDPAVAANWSKVGSYYIGEPLGRRCLTKFGGDLLIITQNGVYPLSAAIQSNIIDSRQALSSKIEQAFNDAARTYSTVFGWMALDFPKQSALIVNVPLAEDGTHHQYVMNTVTKAWTKFIGWDAEDFAIFDSDLYFCDSTAVYKAWDGVSDNSTAIVAYGKTAFSYFGRPGLYKRFTGYQPVLAVNGTLSFLTDLDVDFQDTAVIGTATYTPLSGAIWGSGTWGTSLWGSGLTVLKEWTAPAVYPGKAAAAKIKISSTTLSVQWMANEFAYEYGGIIG
jgi:hypothetical protein